MKKMILVLGLLTFFSLSHQVLAINKGFYIGAGAGYGRLITPNEDVFNTTGLVTQQNTHSRGGWAGRAFLGLNFIKYLGLEAGYAAYTRSHYSATADNMTSTINYYATAADLVGKLYLPIAKTCFNIYGLGGAAYVLERVKFSNGGIPVDNIAIPSPGTTNVNKVRPIYGAGVNFTPTCYLTVGVEYTRIQGTNSFGSNPNAIPNFDLATANVAYNFG